MIPVVYISGYTAAFKCVDNLPNASAFVAKPFLPNQFLDVIERLMPKASPAGQR